MISLPPIIRVRKLLVSVLVIDVDVILVSRDGKPNRLLETGFAKDGGALVARENPGTVETAR
jgi:hypothetical protein